MKKSTKLISLLLICMTSFTLVSCNNETPLSSEPASTVEAPLSLTLSLEGTDEPIDTLEVLENQSIKLVASVIPPNYELTYTWKADDETIISVNDGLITGLKAGSTLLTVNCNEYENLSKLAIVNVKQEKGQKGIGSGKTINDPLFIGNEGKEEPVEVHLIEVTKQYGDAVYIKKGLFDILIDAGTHDDGPAVRNYIEQHMEDKNLDLVIVSHAHEDHYGGMSEALKAVDSVSMFIDYGGNSQSDYSRKRDEFISKGSLFYTAKECVTYTNNAVKDWYLTPEFTLSILDTGNYLADVGKAENANSVACLFKYKDFSYYTAGDLTSSSEACMLNIEQDLEPVTLYKASHHGSHSSNSQALLNILNPFCIGISAAIVNEYASKGHPAGDSIERFYKTPKISSNLNVYWNGVNGDCCFTSYGVANDLTFQGTPTRKGYYRMENGVKVKVSGEENKKFHETEAFKNRGYEVYLPVMA